MVGVRGFVCQVVPIFRTKPQLSDGAAGSGEKEGKKGTKPNPANLTPVQEDTESYQHIALRNGEKLKIPVFAKSLGFLPRRPCVWMKIKSVTSCVSPELTILSKYSEHKLQQQLL